MIDNNLNSVDPELKNVIEFVIKTQKASATLIQRHFKLGYARSAYLLDQLEDYGVVGPVRGAQPREILVKSLDGYIINDLPKINLPIAGAPVLKWKKTVKPDSGFIVNLGKNENKETITVDLEKYKNLILVGSQLTAISELTNQIIAQKVVEKSPDDLKLIVVDGFINQIDLPPGAPHLLTPIIKDNQKIMSALKWLQMEIVNRLRKDDTKDKPEIWLIINGYNVVDYSFYEDKEVISRILSQGWNAKVYSLMTFDYLGPNFKKETLANIGAKVVFRPTTRQMARSSGIPESIKLASPNEAILDTTFEGKTKFTINKKDIKGDYKETFE